jgi:hypothetical protein
VLNAVDKQHKWPILKIPIVEYSQTGKFDYSNVGSSELLTSSESVLSESEIIDLIQGLYSKYSCFSSESDEYEHVQFELRTANISFRDAGIDSVGQIAFIRDLERCISKLLGPRWTKDMSDKLISGFEKNAESFSINTIVGSIQNIIALNDNLDNSHSNRIQDRTQDVEIFNEESCDHSSSGALKSTIQLMSNYRTDDIFVQCGNCSNEDLQEIAFVFPSLGQPAHSLASTVNSLSSLDKWKRKVFLLSIPGRFDPAFSLLGEVSFEGICAEAAEFILSFLRGQVSRGNDKVKVILFAHSFGSFLASEILSQLQFVSQQGIQSTTEDRIVSILNNISFVSLVGSTIDILKSMEMYNEKIPAEMDTVDVFKSWESILTQSCELMYGEKTFSFQLTHMDSNLIGLPILQDVLYTQEFCTKLKSFKNILRANLLHVSGSLDSTTAWNKSSWEMQMSGPSQLYAISDATHFLPLPLELNISLDT